MYDDVLTRNENEELAVRTVSSTEQQTVVNPNDVYTRDTDGNLAVRVVGQGGSGDSHNKGYYATPQAIQEAYPTAEAGDFAIVGSTDTVWIWDEDTSDWVDSDQKGQVTSVNNQTGAVTVQETLISGTNIKTINGLSVLGSGNISVAQMTVPATMPTLAVADWSSNTQSVTVNGVTTTNTVIVSPTPTSADEYAACGILCTAQGANSLTFTCVSVPANDLVVNVIILA